MADKLNKNYKISGSGILNIEDDMIVLCCEDKGEFNLARALADLDGCAVKFSFSYEEDYVADEVTVDPETGEVI